MPDHDGVVWSHPLMSWAQGQKGLSLPAAEAGRAAVEMVSLPARAERAGVLPQWEGPSQRVRFSLFRASWVSPALPVLGGVKTEPCRGRNQPSRAGPAQPLHHRGRQDRGHPAHGAGSHLSELYIKSHLPFTG